MAKIPVITSLNRQDFPEAPEWISTLLYPLQLFMSTVINALRNQLTLQDNFSCVIRQFTITAGPLATDNTVSFPANLGRSIVELNIHCTNADGTYVPIFPQASWNYISGQVVVNGIQGLTSGVKYQITVTAK
jgi:hypothetical protein